MYVFLHLHDTYKTSLPPKISVASRKSRANGRNKSAILHISTEISLIFQFFFLVRGPLSCNLYPANSIAYRVFPIRFKFEESSNCMWSFFESRGRRKNRKQKRYTVMAASSSSVPFLGIREEEQNQMRQQHSSTPSSSATPAAPAQKKKRNQPGTPNPDAEVIALSPKTLMATNRFICEVCNKGFQREQNLQLHRRGHNLPWKLKQKTTKEPKRKVYLCPEPTCVHHDPSRALGDLTGIKKHYSRKHGEKKWKCEKCSKRYAVQSDWKAHSKTCGTREYRCDCGTLFSRRDSFITHRAFCDALAQETARHPVSLTTSIGGRLYGGGSNIGSGLSQVGQQISTLQDQTNRPTDILRLGCGGGRTGQFNSLLHGQSIASSFRPPQPSMASSAFFMTDQTNQNFHEESLSQQGLLQNKAFHGLMQYSDLQSNPNTSSNPNLFNLEFLSNSNSNTENNENDNNNSNVGSAGFLMSNQFNVGANGNGSEAPTIFAMADQVGSNAVPSLYTTSMQNNANIPHMSATALLQKAAQLGSTSSANNTGASLLRSFGSTSSGGPKSERSILPTNMNTIFSENEHHHLQDLMNSYATGNSAFFSGGPGGITAFGGYDGSRSSIENLEEPKLHQTPSVSIGGSDRLTRDFLGVGQIVRTVSGGFSQREQKQQQHGIDHISSINADQNSNAAASSSHSYGVGGRRGSFQ